MTITYRNESVRDLVETARHATSITWGRTTPHYLLRRELLKRGVKYDRATASACLAVIIAKVGEVRHQILPILDAIEKGAK